MKDLAEAAVGLAYSSLLFNNRSLAAEVGTLEARSDQLARRARVLGAARGAGGPRPRRAPGPAPPRPPRASTICDAARDMTWYVEQGEPLHPVVQMALEETEETSAETIVQPGSPAEGRSLQGAPRSRPRPACSCWRSSAAPRWIYRPRGTFMLLAGDRLISVGPEEGEDELIALCGEQPSRLGTRSRPRRRQRTPAGQAEPDALLGDGHLLDVVEAALGEPVEHPRDEVLGRARAARERPRSDAPRASRVDLGLVVDEVAGLTALARHLRQPVRVRRVLRADHEQHVDLRATSALHGVLAVLGGVADVFPRRALEAGVALLERAHDLAASRRPTAWSA